MDMKLGQLRFHFEKERERLAEELRRLGDGNLSVGGREGNAFSKSTEAATGTTELARRVAFEQSLRGRLSGMEGALRKLDEGTYGICDGCGQAIDPARLETLPEASLCRNCADMQKKQSHRAI